jgi:hypothetical protein
VRCKYQQDFPNLEENTLPTNSDNPTRQQQQQQQQQTSALTVITELQ